MELDFFEPGKRNTMKLWLRRTLVRLDLYAAKRCLLLKILPRAYIIKPIWTIKNKIATMSNFQNSNCIYIKGDGKSVVCQPGIFEVEN